MKTKLLQILTLGLGAALAGLPAAENESRPRLEAELIEADRGFSSYSEKHGMRAAFDAYAAEEAFRFENGVGVVQGRAAIDAFNRDVPADFVLTWRPLRAEVAASGDMGYTFGTYSSRRKAGDGGTVTRTGHYLTLWKRQTDGTWKWIFDTGVPDPPQTPPAPD